MQKDQINGVGMTQFRMKDDDGLYALDLDPYNVLSESALLKFNKSSEGWDRVAVVAMNRNGFSFDILVLGQAVKVRVSFGAMQEP